MSVCTNFDCALSRGRPLEQRLDHGAVAEQQEFDVGMARERQYRRPAERPMAHGRRPWRQVRCEPYPAWIDLDGVGVGAGNPGKWNRRERRDHNRSATADKPVLPAALGLLDGHDLPPPSRFFSDASAAKGCSPASSTLRRVQIATPGFARIGVDAEDQEFGRERAQIDLAVDQRFRRLLAFARLFAQRLSGSSASPLARR